MPLENDVFIPKSSLDGMDVVGKELGDGNKKLNRKDTVFAGGISPKPSGDIAQSSFDLQTVRSKWIWNRRKDRLDDTQQWLHSKGLLKPEDLKNLKKLSSEDKKQLQALLRVSRIKEGVKSPKDRLKIRAQVVLMAARTGSIKQAAEHRKRLTENHLHTKTRLYQSLDPQTFFSPHRVAGRSMELRAKESLYCEVSAQKAKSSDMGFVGPKLVNPDRLREAVRSLIDKKMLDKTAALYLRGVLHRENARNPQEVQESDMFRTTDLLWREVRHQMATNKDVRSHMAGFKDLAFTGSRLDRSKSVQKAVNTLIDNDLLNEKSARNLRKTFEHMPNRINILMNIDRKQAPDRKDREKIRAAVLLRTAHFGTEEGRRFKEKLLSRNVRYTIDFPKVDKAEVKKDVAIVDKTMAQQHPNNVNELYAEEQGDNVGIPKYKDYEDVGFEDDNRRMDISLNKPCHILLSPLGTKSRSDDEVKRQWHAITQKDFNPETALSAYGSDAKDIKEAIEDIVDRTYRLNNMSNWASLHQGKAKARELLQAVNHQLPKDLPMPERLQALGEASAIFLQRNDDPTQKPSGKTTLPCLEQAYKKWPVRERYVSEYAFEPVRERQLEDSDFIKQELVEAVYSKKIGKVYIFSPALRRLIEAGHEQFKQQNNEATRKTLNTVFGDGMPVQDKNEISRLLQKQRPFLDGFHETLRSWGLDHLEDPDVNDAVQSQQILRPLQEKMGQMTESPRETVPRRGVRNVEFQPSQDRTIVFDRNEAVVDKHDDPNARVVQQAQHSHKALLGAIVTSKFAEHYKEAIKQVSNAKNFKFTSETVKNCLTDAVDATLEDCNEIEHYSFDDAQDWIKTHRKDPRRRKSVANINDNYVKPRRMTQSHLENLNDQWDELGKQVLPPRDHSRQVRHGSVWIDRNSDIDEKDLTDESNRDLSSRVPRQSSPIVGDYEDDIKDPDTDDDIDDGNYDEYEPYDHRIDDKEDSRSAYNLHNVADDYYNNNDIVEEEEDIESVNIQFDDSVD